MAGGARLTGPQSEGAAGIPEREPGRGGETQTQTSLAMTAQEAAAPGHQSSQQNQFDQNSEHLAGNCDDNEHENLTAFQPPVVKIQNTSSKNLLRPLSSSNRHSEGSENGPLNRPRPEEGDGGGGVNDSGTGLEEAHLNEALQQALEHFQEQGGANSPDSPDNPDNPSIYTHL